MFRVRIQVPDLEFATKIEATKAVNDLDKVFNKHDIDGEIIPFEEGVIATYAGGGEFTTSKRHDDIGKVYKKAAVAEPEPEPVE